MGATVLVAGASGLTGQRVVRFLRESGHAVRAGLRWPEDARLFSGIETAVMDYADPGSLAVALRGIKTVYYPPPLAPDLGQQGEHLLAAAIRAGITRVVRLSAIGAGHETDLRFVRWHRAGEVALEASGLEWVHLRCNIFMQSFLARHEHSIRAKDLFYDAVGPGRVSYVDVEDVAAVVVAALTRPELARTALTLTGPEALSCHDIARIFSDVAGRTIRCREVGVDAACDALIGFGTAPDVAEAVAELFALMLRDGCAETSPAIPDLLGRPARSFQAFAETVQAQLTASRANGSPPQCS